MKNILEFSKQLMLDNLNSEAIVVDATVGNGNDAKFLCDNFKFVYGFDIQKEAITSADKVLEDYENYQLNLDCHSNVLNYVTKCDGAIFNLGYLPNYNHEVTTKPNTTIKAIESLISIINKGIIVIVVYTGHDNSFEANLVENYVSNLDKQIDVLKYQFLNREHAPYILAVRIK